MSELKTTTSNYWTSTQAFALAAASLLLGVCGGLAIRKVTETRATTQVVAAPEAAASPAAPMPAIFGTMTALFGQSLILPTRLMA